MHSVHNGLKWYCTEQKPVYWELQTSTKQGHAKIGDDGSRSKGSYKC